jgi:hypothetical protein
MLLSSYYSWMMHGKGKSPFCAKIGIVIPLLIFKIQCTNSGRVFYFDELLNFYSKSETLFMLSSITKKEEIESASRPLSILVIENNTNKDLIVSMSIKHKFRYPKKRKGKRDPQIRTIQMKGLLLEEGAQTVLQIVFMIL